jgi:fatty-acyl-CoA synthase
MFQEWRGQTFPGVLEYSARNWPDNVAVRSDEEAITFKELQSGVQNVALALHELGVRRGDHVAYMMSVSPRWVELFFAVLSLGAKLVPLNLTWVGAEIPQGLKLTGAKYLLIGAEHRGESLVAKFTDALPELSGFDPGQCAFSDIPLKTVMVAGAADSVPSFAYDFESLVEDSKGAVWPPQKEYTIPSPDDDGLLLLTSGTTSFPKPVIHTHQSMLCGICNYADGLEAGDTDTFLLTTPNYHVGGIISMCIPIIRGGTSRLMHWFDPEEAMRLIESDPVTLFWGFDTHFAMMRNDPSYGKFDLSSITRTMSGSNPATFDAIYDMGFEHVGSLYGTSESMGGSSYFPYRDRFDFERMKQSNGRPTSGDIRIISQDTGNELPVGEPGEICVNGPSLFKGYYNLPDETAKCIDEDGFFHTGDYGWVDADGYVYYRGRYKEIIKTGGENVSMLEVELFLASEIPGVLKAVICGVPDEKWGEAIIALIESEPDAGLTQESVREACRGKLAGYKIPKRVFLVGNDTWKITPTGKLDRFSARDTALALIDGE